MIARTLGPADHAFVSALSAQSLMILHDPREEALYVDIANRMLGRLSGNKPAQLQRLVLEFASFRMAMPNPQMRSSAQFHLDCALHDFHRWRMAMAVSAADAQLAEKRDI